MRLNGFVDVLTPSPLKKNDKGQLVTTYSVSRTIRGDFQAVKTDIIREITGLTDLATHVVFCKDFLVTPKNRLKVNGDTWRITSITQLPKHVEIYVQKVI